MDENIVDIRIPLIVFRVSVQIIEHSNITGWNTCNRIIYKFLDEIGKTAYVDISQLVL